MTRWRVAIAGALSMTLLIAAPGLAQIEGRPRLVPPVRGEALLGHLAPVTKVAGNEVVTTWRVKNLSSAPIAGLKVEEFWYDRSNNLVPGDSQTVRKPIPPGEVITIELRTPKDERMTRNQYRFSHQNGTIKTELLKTLD